VLTEQREEIEIKIQDDDMAERAQEIGLLMGDEDPRLSQTQLAEREAERERLSSPIDGGGTAAIDADAGTTEGAVEVEEEEPEEEVDDSAPLVTTASKRGDDDDIVPTSPLGGLRATMTDDGEIIVDEIVDDELPAPVEDEEEDQGYVLEDEDEDYTEEEEEDEGPLAHSTDDDY